MKYQVKIFAYSEKDTYEEGCIGFSRDSGCIDVSVFKTPEEVVKHLQVYGEVYRFENRLEVQRMENANNYEPSKRELEQWKLGKCDLYCATYSAYISIITDIDETELTKLFPEVRES